jgi:hypothetical protein
VANLARLFLSRRESDRHRRARTQAQAHLAAFTSEAATSLWSVDAFDSASRVSPMGLRYARSRSRPGAVSLPRWTRLLDHVSRMTLNATE